ncbi:MAG: J domain-containing protein [Cyanobacteria bacterium K_Offshore_surface_m2_239]|nr:J domain-containing protein [Cyanobacteria bacterium K_Offshore_surface_m2_239]
MPASKKASGTSPPALNSYVRAEIDRLAAEYGLDTALLQGFAHFIIAHYKKKEPKPPKTPRPVKPKPLTNTQLKTAVLQRFGCADIKALKANKDFQMAMAGEKLNFSSRDDLLKLYRQWVGVPEDERALEGPTTINGIDVLLNFRPWIVFDLDPKTASVEDVNDVFRKLVKVHHPDCGGDARVFQQLQVMRDTLLAYFQ